jgi:hypothetical protein
MDKRTYHRKSSIQSIMKNKELCERTLYCLVKTKEKMDKPLETFTKEDISELAEQLRSIINRMRSLPAQTLAEYIHTPEIVFRNLQNAIIDLNLALDQCISNGNKALLYRHLLSSQENFTAILHVLSEISDLVNVHTALPAIVNLPHRSSFNSKQRPTIHFSRNVLADLFASLCDLDGMGVEQCEQGISEMKKLRALFEKQKNLLDTSYYEFHNEEDYVILRCKVGVELTYADELALKLINLFSAFQVRCRSQSRQVARYREEIMYFLTLLRHHYDDMLPKIREMNALQDQARFPYKPLEPPLEDIISL